MLSEKPWRIEAVVQLCLALFFFFFLGGVSSALLHEYGGEKFKETTSFATLVIGTLSLHGVTLVLIGVFLHQHRVSWAEAIGFRKPDRWKSVAIAVLAACVVIPLAGSLQMVSAYGLTHIGWKPELQPIVTLLKVTAVWWKRAYVAVFAILLAPLVEEFIFRGMLYPLLKQYGYPRLAWVGVSLSFALIHGNAAAFVSFFVLALALTWLYEQTDSLLAPITVHALFNATNFALLLYQEQQLQLTP